MNDRTLSRHLALALLLGAFPALAQTRAPLRPAEIYSFNGNVEGASPDNPGLLAQGTDGHLYGTLPAGGNGNGGAWFQYGMSGAPSLTNMWPSTGLYAPHSGLTLGIDGNFYGAAPPSGSVDGALFKISGGTVTTVYPFNPTNPTKFTAPGGGPVPGGSNPVTPLAPPVQGLDGNLYGVAKDGWVYQVILHSTGPATPGWTLQVPTGSTAPLLLANDGNFYGTYPNGSLSWNAGVAVTSPNGSGGIFAVTPAGVLTWFYNLNPSSANGGDGQNPQGPVMQAADGNLYGTAKNGGAHGHGVIYKIALDGSGYTPIYSFQPGDGTAPYGGLVQDSDHYLYGLTSADGTLSAPNNGPNLVASGTLFKVDTNGNFLRRFTFYYDSTRGGLGSGYDPMATPTLHTNGSIYGMTFHGGFTINMYGTAAGTNDDTGEFFSFNDELSPFISVVGQRSAHVGDRITIIGQGFLNAAGITFGGVAGPWVKFNPTIWNDTSMTVTVPVGAKTGVITVYEPTGNLSTTYNFTIMCSSPFCFPIHRF